MELYTEKVNGELRLQKYKKTFFFNNLWDSSLLEMRGRVVDSDNNVIVNPFTKIFNYGENNTTCPLEAEVLWVEKINGFMGAVTLYKGELLYTTTGSFDSQFTKMLEESIPYFIAPSDNVTYLFEIVHPNDPHIIREKPGVYLIGCRSLDSLEYNSSLEKEQYLDTLGFKRPKYGLATFADVLEKAKTAQIEGYCVYSSEISSTLGKHNALKIKSPFYLKAKALARGNRALDDDFAVIKKIMPLNLNEQERLDFIFNYLSLP